MTISITEHNSETLNKFSVVLNTVAAEASYSFKTRTKEKNRISN